MSDPFVLNSLSNGLTIGDAEYYVTWNPKLGAATIFVSPVEADDPLDTLMLGNLVGDDGEPLTFSSELLAHAFLLELRKENAVLLHDDKG